MSLSRSRPRYMCFETFSTNCDRSRNGSPYHTEALRTAVRDPTSGLDGKGAPIGDGAPEVTEVVAVHDQTGAENRVDC
jgi:hypothetical protein